MKKQFLLGVLLIGSIIITSAQTTYGESFFLGSGLSGFALGNINDQRGWSSVTSEGLAIESGTISQFVPESLSDEFGLWGALKISADPNFGPAAEGSSFGCFSPSLINIPFVAGHGDMATWIFIDVDDNEQTPGAAYEIQMQDAANNITSKVGSFSPMVPLKYLIRMMVSLVIKTLVLPGHSINGQNLIYTIILQQGLLNTLLIT